MSTQDQPLTREQLAKLYQVGTRTVMRWVNDGMPVMRPSPGTVRFDPADVAAWMKSRTAPKAVSA